MATLADIYRFIFKWSKDHIEKKFLNVKPRRLKIIQNKKRKKKIKDKIDALFIKYLKPSGILIYVY